MIYTLTTNPAIDMNISSHQLVGGQVNRTFDAVYSPNGKGLNVSFVLQHFGMASKILGFFGGFSGQYIVEQARRKQCEVLPIWVEDITRINVFLNDGQQEYKLVNEGAFISSQAQQKLLEQLEQLTDLRLLSINGSLACGIDEAYYEAILEICARKQAKVILDISSQNLPKLLAYRPYLIKPNDEEIRSIFGFQLDTPPQIVQSLHQLHQLGATNILLTLGEKGAYFSNGKQIYFASAKPIKLVSSACAGDAALAAFLSIWLPQPENIIPALKRAAATGANVAESNGLGDLANVAQYQQAIAITRIENRL